MAKRSDIRADYNPLSLITDPESLILESLILESLILEYLILESLNLERRRDHMVEDFYFAFGLPEILVGLAVLALLVFGGVKLAKLFLAALVD